MPAPSAGHVTEIPVSGGTLLIFDSVMTQHADARAHVMAAAPNPLPAGTITLPVVSNLLTFVRAYAFINPSTCTYIENGSFSSSTPPTHGALTFSTEDVNFGGSCPGPFPSAVARYTWTDASAALGSNDFFSLHFVTTSGGASADTNWLAVLGVPASVQISRNGINITDPQPSAQNVFVGEQVSLVGSVQGLPSGVAITSQRWAIDATTVGGFSVDPGIDGTGNAGPQTLGKVLPTDFSKISTIFYWVAPSSTTATTQRAHLTVSLSNGTALTGSATFALSGPDFVQSVPKLGHAQARSAGPHSVLVSFGTENLTAPGIYVVPPASAPANHPGVFTWIQILSKDHFIIDSTSTCDLLTEGALDDRAPAATGAMYDWPDFNFDDSNISVVRDFSARAYALWSPNISGSIPVPIAHLDWGFTMVATKRIAGPQVNYAAFPMPAALTQSSEYPQWSDVHPTRKPLPGPYWTCH
jgi:hypothetical protein